MCNECDEGKVSLMIANWLKLLIAIGIIFGLIAFVAFNILFLMAIF